MRKKNEHGRAKKSAKLKTWEPMNRASLTSLHVHVHFFFSFFFHFTNLFFYYKCNTACKKIKQAFSGVKFHPNSIQRFIMYISS